MREKCLTMCDCNCVVRELREKHARRARLRADSPLRTPDTSPPGSARPGRWRDARWAWALMGGRRARGPAGGSRIPRACRCACAGAAGHACATRV